MFCRHFLLCALSFWIMVWDWAAQPPPPPPHFLNKRKQIISTFCWVRKPPKGEWFPYRGIEHRLNVSKNLGICAAKSFSPRSEIKPKYLKNALSRVLSLVGVFFFGVISYFQKLVFLDCSFFWQDFRICFFFLVFFS